MAGPTKFLLGKDVNGNVDYSLAPCSLTYTATLASEMESTLTVPTSYGVWKVLFSIEDGANVWIAYDATSAAPAGSTFATSTSELNPKIRYVNGGTVIHAVTNSTTANISISLYWSEPNL